MTDFEAHVIDALARLETNMASLVGNGQPGRINRIEKKVLYLILGGVLLACACLGPQAVTSIIATLFK